MITKLVVDFFTVILSGILGLMPSLTLPSWVSSIATELTSALSIANQLGYWVPVQAIGLVASFVLLCYGISVTIRITRIVASFFTGGGGSAA